MRRPSGRKRVQLLVAYGVRADGSRQLLAFVRSQGESQAAWEGLLEDLYRRGLEGQKLKLIVTDGCAGLMAALQTVYPRVPHQRCWVHKMRKHGASGPQAGCRGDHSRCSGHLQCRGYPAGPQGFRKVSAALASVLSQPGSSTGEGLARSVDLLSVSQVLVEKAAHHQCRSSDVLWKCVAGHVPWCVLSIFTVWIALSLRSSTSLISSGETAPSEFLHKQLDMTKTNPEASGLLARPGVSYLTDVVLALGE